MCQSKYKNVSFVFHQIPISSRFCQRADLIRQKKKLFSSKNVLKQTKIPDFSDVIYARSKKLLKMMWLSRSPKALDYFSPQKWKVKACSM